MRTTYYILLGVAVIVAVAFTGLVFFTGKGDAMSGGGGSVRTTFKGKASFDDQMFRLTVVLAGIFMALMLILDIVAGQAFKN